MQIKELTPGRNRNQTFGPGKWRGEGGCREGGSPGHSLGSSKGGEHPMKQLLLKYNY